MNNVENMLMKRVSATMGEESLHPPQFLIPHRRKASKFPLRRKKPLTLKIFFFLITTDILETAAQFCFKKTSLGQASFTYHSPRDILHFVSQAVINPYLWCALIMVFTLFCIWVMIISKIDLSVAVPVASFSYIIIPLTSIIFLGEHVPVMRWLGIGVILIGVILVSVSSHHQEVT